MNKFSTCTGCTLINAPMAKYDGAPDADIVVVGGYPLEVDCNNAPFVSYKSAMVRRMLADITKDMPKHVVPKIVYTYAAMCCPKDFEWKMEAETVHRCSVNLMSYLDRVRPKVIVAMGMDAARALGLKGSQGDLRGGMYTVRLANGVESRCFTTYHIAQVDKSPGFMPVLMNDLRKAVKFAVAGQEGLQMDLHIATTFEDTLALIDKASTDIDGYIAEFVSPGMQQLVSVDTETTSVLSYPEDTRMISVSISYDKVSGIAYPIDHVQAGFTPEQVGIVLKRTEELLSKPRLALVMNNAKFDTQWLKYKYGLQIPDASHDTMLLEHILEEDKKGEYSLKDIVRDRFPELGGYEANLHEDLDAVTAQRVEEAKQRATEIKDKIVATIAGWWCDLSDKQRSSILAGWVDAGHLLLSETGGLSSIKVRKVKGELRVTKGYIKQITKLVDKVPMDALGEADESFASTIHALQMELARGSAVQPATFEDIELHKLLRYGAIDAFSTRQVFANQLERVKQENAIITRINRRRQVKLDIPDVLTPYRKITMPMCRVLTDMEYRGITLDRDKIVAYMDVVKEKMAEKLDAMYTTVGYKFNTSASAPDLSRILFEEMKLPVLKTTEGGAPSTDADTLKELSDRFDNPFLSQILSYRKLDKCLNTYLLSWFNRSALDGKIHCSYNQIGTATYRLSSSNPNLGRSLEVVKPRELRGHPTA